MEQNINEVNKPQPKTVHIPYTEQMIEQQEKLSKLLEIIVLAHRENEMEEAIKILRGMSKTSKRRNWQPQQISSSEFVIELPSENALIKLSNFKTTMEM